MKRKMTSLVLCFVAVLLLSLTTGCRETDDDAYVPYDEEVCEYGYCESEYGYNNGDNSYDEEVNNYEEYEEDVAEMAAASFVLSLAEVKEEALDSPCFFL